MADIRFTALDETTSPGPDYIIPMDSPTDGVKKVLPANLGISTAAQAALDLKADTSALGALATEDVVTSALLDADVFSTAHSWSGVQTFTNPVVGTQTLGDNTTKAASTAFVQSAIAASGGGDLISTNNLSDVADAGTSLRNLGGIDASNPVSITGTTTITGSGFGKLHIISGTSANYTVTLPTPVGNTGSLLAFQVALPASASKLYTLSTPSGVIGRQGASFIVWASETVVLRSDGTNWTVIDGKPCPFVGGFTRTTGQSFTSGSSYTAAVFTAGSSDPSGLNLCFSAANGWFIAPRAGGWSCAFNVLITQTGSPTYAQGVLGNASIFLSGTFPNLGPLTNAVVAGSGVLNLAAGDDVRLFVRADGTSPSVAGASVTARFFYTEIPAW